MNKTGFCIAGCGSVAQIHARALDELDEANLVLAYSRSKENAEELAEEHGIEATDDWSEVSEHQDINVITICTPSGTHLDYGKRAARDGFHVVTEKPIEVTIDRGRELIDVCDEEGVHLSVIFQNRFIPDLKQMKSDIENGVIGDVHLADAYIKWFRDQAYYDEGGWRGTLDLDGGGALINQSIHTIDLLQWLVGDVQRVFGKTGTYTHSGIEGEDTGVGIVEFESGGIGVIEGATSVQPAQDRRLEIHGDEGTAVLEDESYTLLTGDDENQDPEEEEDEEEEATGASSPFSGFSIQPHHDQYSDIVSAIQEGEASSVSGDEALKSLAIIRGIYRANKQDHPVELAELLS
jgi:predicted dehydrogenase